MTDIIADGTLARVDSFGTRLEATLRLLAGKDRKQRAVNIALLDYLDHQYSEVGSSERLAAALREAIKP